MTTAATIHTANGARWYYPDGQPCYELPKAKGDGVKSPTLADARKLNLLPSVTTILQLLDKPALNDWKVEQGVLAVLTTPRLPGELDDAFVHRVLQVERVQDQESTKARDIGTAIHAALEDYFTGQEVDPDIRPWMDAAAKEVAKQGELVTAEKILVGDGYAGKTDLIQEAKDVWKLWDFKTTRKLPEKCSWDEHVLQLAAYAAAYFKKIAFLEQASIRTFNCYISTIEQGKFIIHENSHDWQKDYGQGFAPLVIHWQWKNSYRPQQ